MNNSFKTTTIISDDYKDLISKDINEKIVLSIMNESKNVFPEKYKRIIDQSHGESDFISDSKIKYDCKLLFSQKQCEELGATKGNFNSFINFVRQETNDMFDAISKKDEDLVKNTILYKEMVKRIKSANNCENIILFIPFSLTMEFEESITDVIADDIFYYIWRVICKNENNIDKNNNIYMIYPNYENKIIIKNLNKHIKEYLENDIISKYYLITSIE